MKAVLIIVAIWLLCSCSLMMEPPNPRIVCKTAAQACPASAEALEVVLVFQGEVAPELNPDEPLVVNWYDHGAIPSWDGSVLVGQTISKYEVNVVEWRPLFHELAHVDFWRRFGNPDYNHGEPPGPWQPELEEQIRAAYLEAGY